MNALPVTFVLLNDAPLERLATLNPDRDWREFVTGERAWILQTYLRLRARGYPVQLEAHVPACGLAVFNSKQRNLLTRTARRTRATLVGVRQDVGEPLIADFQVVQNRSQADGQRRFFIPHWPQPGLIPRDPARGARIETVAFKGLSGNLHPAFHAPPWRAFLERNHIRWLTDAVSAADGSAGPVTPGIIAWNDYSKVDVVLAVRPPDKHLHPRKPGTKLYNAWLAGAPALLGPELAYRELRTSALDYLEVSTPQEAAAALLRLCASPDEYLRRIEHGRLRMQDFSAEALTARWAELLFHVLPAQAEAPHVRRWRGRSLRWKELARRLQRSSIRQNY